MGPLRFTMHSGGTGATCTPAAGAARPGPHRHGVLTAAADPSDEPTLGGGAPRARGNERRAQAQVKKPG